LNYDALSTKSRLFDPPYGQDADRDPGIYSEENLQVAVHAREWAIEHGDDPKLRIALCGYAGEHDMPANWRVLEWKTGGGYGNQNSGGRGKRNANRERIWFSPHCLVPDQRELF
jgi:DNA adenine methylase